MIKLNLSVSLHTGTRQTCPSTLSIIAFTFPLELTNFKPRRWHFQMFSFNPCWHTPSNITNQAAVGWLKECVVLAPAGCPVVLGLVRLGAILLLKWGRGPPALHPRYAKDVAAFWCACGPAHASLCMCLRMCSCVPEGLWQHRIMQHLEPSQLIPGVCGGGGGCQFSIQ